jgi:hypothetical protein
VGLDYYRPQGEDLEDEARLDFLEVRLLFLEVEDVFIVQI